MAPYLVTPALHDVGCVKLVGPPLNEVLPLHGQPLPHKQSLHAQLCQEQTPAAPQGALPQGLCWTCSTRPAQWLPRDRNFCDHYHGLVLCKPLLRTRGDTSVSTPAPALTIKQSFTGKELQQCMHQTQVNLRAFDAGMQRPRLQQGSCTASPFHAPLCIRAASDSWSAPLGGRC